MTMIVLPPSEGKATASSRTTLKLKALSFPELTPQREQALAGLVALSNGSLARARTALGLTKNQDFEISRNQELLSAPAAPAWQVYTGVLYEAIGITSLSARAMSKLCDSTYVMSALFGLISIGDKIPAYRLSGDCTLPKVGTLTKLWSPVVSSVFANTDEFIIDLRSGTYVSLGQIPSIANSVTPRILQKMPSGPPKVITHHNKATKGRLVRAIVQQTKSIKDVESLAEVVSALGADVEVEHVKGRSVLNVVVAAF